MFFVSVLLLIFMKNFEIISKNANIVVSRDFPHVLMVFDSSEDETIQIQFSPIILWWLSLALTLHFCHPQLS